MGYSWNSGGTSYVDGYGGTSKTENFSIHSHYYVSNVGTSAMSYMQG
jgi:hypothetical protein